MTPARFAARPRDLLSRTARLAVVIAAVAIWQPAPASHADDLTAALKEIKANASEAKKSRDFSLVEEERQGRLEMLADATDDSPWVRGFLSLGKADELIATMQYAECCTLLRASWEPFATPPDGLVFGDIALKMFECCMAALTIHPDCLDDGNPKRIATRQELQTMVNAAAAGDPCVTEAVVAAAYLTDLDPAEAFLPAEVRPSVQSRTQRLLTVTHAPDGNEPLLPWHGAAELLKARSTVSIIDDLVYRPAFLRAPRRGSLTGWDAHNNVVHLVYDRLFLMLLPTEGGQMAVHAVYLDPKGAWRRAVIRLIRYGTESNEPTPPGNTNPSNANPGSTNAGSAPANSCEAAAMQAGAPANPPASSAGSTAVVRALDAAKPLAEFAVGTNLLRLHALPPEQMVEAVTTLPVIGVDKWQTIVTAAKQLAKNPGTGGATTLGPALLLPQSAARLPWFFNSLDAIQKDAAARKPPASSMPIPLESMRLLLVVCEPALRDTFQPPFLHDEQQRPFVALADGRRMLINANRGIVEIPGRTATECIPLQLSTTPDTILTATPSGRQYMALLASSGYSRPLALAEFIHAAADPTYVPPKLSNALSRSRKADRGLPPAPQQAAMADPLASLRETFQTQGFRHLLTPRNEFVVPPETLGAGAESPVAGGTSAAERADSPFRILAAGGENTERAAPYTTAQYQRLYDTLFLDFFQRAVANHPCLPVWTAIDQARAQLAPLPFIPPTAPSPPSPPPPPPPPLPPQPADPNAVVPPNEIVIDTSKLTKDLAAWHREAFLPPPPTSGQAAPVERMPAALSSLLALYHEEARRQFAKGDLHRAAVLYQDLGRRLAAPPRCDPRLQSPPDGSQLAAFTQAVVANTTVQEHEIIVRGEQSCVLDAAGLRPQAERLRRSVIDRLEIGILPLLDQLADTATGVGLHPSDELTAGRERIDSLRAQIAALPSADSRAIATEAAGEPSPQAAAILDKIRSEIAARSAEKPGAPADDGMTLDRLVAELRSQPRRLSDWCAEKLLFQAALPEHLLAAHTVIPLEMFCPAKAYDRAAGFRNEPRLLLSEDLTTRMQQWLSLPSAEAAVRPDAGENNFLLGWFWLERGNPERAHAAFAAAARAFDATASRDRTVAGLVARRNAMFVALGAASIVDPDPQSLGLQVGALEDLRLQMLLWKRQWSLLGQPARDAQREFDHLVEGSGAVRSAWQRQEMRDANRYYFFDYRFQHGAVPDALVSAIADNLDYAEGRAQLPRADFKPPQGFDAAIMKPGQDAAQ